MHVALYPLPLLAALAAILTGTAGPGVLSRDELTRPKVAWTYSLGESVNARSQPVGPATPSTWARRAAACTLDAVRWLVIVVMVYTAATMLRAGLAAGAKAAPVVTGEGAL